MDRKWQWVLLAVLVFMMGGPTLLAALAAPPGWRFLSGLASPDDVSVYLAAMYQGARGAWLYRPPFDPTMVPALLMHSLYTTLGHLARWLGADLALLYHLARIACGLLCVFVAHKWSAELFPERRGQTTAWILVAFSSGLAWMLALVPSRGWQARLVDLRLPEASTFLAASTAPHFALGIALEALALLAFWRATVRRRWVLWSLVSGAALWGQGLVYPFTLPVVYLTMLGYVIVTLLKAGYHRIGRVLAAALIAGGTTLPFLCYYVWTFFLDPFWKGTHVTQNVVSTPGLGWLAVGYGLPLALAVLGGLASLRGGDGPWKLLVLWAVGNGLLVYLPLPFQWRLANGWHLVLCLLAARGLEESVLPWLANRRAELVLRRWTPDPTGTLRRGLLILAAPSSLLVSLVGVRVAVAEQGFPYYYPMSELRAMAAVAPNLDWDDVVLGAYPTGNVLPTRALCRVVVGQQFATLDPLGKLGDIQRFFQAETPDEERRAILQEYGVTVVYHGRWEQAMGDFDPSSAPYLHEIQREGQTVVYRVEGEPSAATRGKP
jgi:hypothetical protein